MMQRQGFVVWLTGLSGSGKSTIAKGLEFKLKRRGCAVEILDGDIVRTHLSKGLGFSRDDRDTNIRRIGFVANLLSRNGVVTIVSAISPYRSVRNELRQTVTNFVEVYVNAPLAVCEARDVKGLYAKARTGEIQCFTGISDPYEEPLHPEVVCYTTEETIDQSIDKVIARLEQTRLIPLTFQIEYAICSPKRLRWLSPDCRRRSAGRYTPDCDRHTPDQSVPPLPRICCLASRQSGKRRVDGSKDDPTHRT